MLTQTSSCPGCGQTNSYSTVNCIECGGRLPWADALAARQQEAEEATKNALQAQAGALNAPAAQSAPGALSPRAGGMMPPTTVLQPTGSLPQFAAAGTIGGFDQRLALGAGGSLLLAMGVFMPMVTVPFLGTVTYFGSGNRDGVIILLLAIGSAFLAISRQYRPLALTGGVSLFMLLYLYISFKRGMAQVEAMGGDNPFMRGIAQSLSSVVQLQYGLPVMLIGAALLISSAVLDYRSQ